MSDKKIYLGFAHICSSNKVEYEYKLEKALLSIRKKGLTAEITDKNTVENNGSIIYSCSVKGYKLYKES